nr:MAG TPA_asm: NinG recombination protein [Caudoviricetes sp.]
MARDKFYTSSGWERMRRSILRAERYRCQNCARYGKMTPATVVHHANPVEERPDLRMTRWNMVALCGECHNAMHDRETHKLTVLGERWRARVSPPPSGAQKELRETGARKSFQ